MKKDDMSAYFDHGERTHRQIEHCLEKSDAPGRDKIIIRLALVKILKLYLGLTSITGQELLGEVLAIFTRQLIDILGKTREDVEKEFNDGNPLP